MFLAGVASRPATLEDRLQLLPRLAGRRHLGDAPGVPASPGRGEPPAATPTPAPPAIDSQSVKTVHGGEAIGVDGGKKVHGRKRHIATDTLGLVLAVVVTAANVDDGVAAPQVLELMPGRDFPRLRVVLADSKYHNHDLYAWLRSQRPPLPGGGGEPAGGGGGIRAAAEALGGGADAGVAGSLPSPGPRPRAVGRDECCNDPVVGPPSYAASTATHEAALSLPLSSHQTKGRGMILLEQSLSLMMDGSGNLYGTTGDGGGSLGGVFELAHGSNTITRRASFNGTNGYVPDSDLITDGSGNLYGTTVYGGAFFDGGEGSGDGEIFELAKGSSNITTLASFSGTHGGTNGQHPHGGVIMDGSGNLYGTTTGITRAAGNGTITDWGTIFELAKGSGTITTLASFNGSNGGDPYGALIMDGSGNLYGTTVDGGATNLTARCSSWPRAAAPSPRWRSFNGTNGAVPIGALIMDGSGNLYGTTIGGGASGEGTVFELAKGSSTITTLASFNGTNGAKPVCRSDHGRQRQSVRHNVFGRSRPISARYSSWPTVAARSPRWRRSVAPTDNTRMPADHGRQR